MQNKARPPRALASSGRSLDAVDRAAAQPPAASRARIAHLLLALLLAGCAAASKEARPSTPAMGPSQSPEAELAQLESQINGGLSQLGLSPLASAPRDYSLDSPSGAGQPTPATTGTEPEADASTAEPPQPQAAPRLAAEESSRRGRRAEKKAERDACERTCEVIDSICDAAERICQIAERLPPDSGAPERCERATTACESAREQGESCGCS